MKSEPHRQCRASSTLRRRPCAPASCFLGAPRPPRQRRELQPPTAQRFLPPNLSFSGACKAAQLQSIVLRFVFQARCFPEAEFSEKVLVEMFASGVGRKKEIPRFDSVKTLQRFIWMPSSALRSSRGGLSSLQCFCEYLLQWEHVLHLSERRLVTLLQGQGMKWGETGS